MINTKGKLLGGETYLITRYVCWKEMGWPFGPSTSYLSNMCFRGKYARIHTHQSTFLAPSGNRKEWSPLTSNWLAPNTPSIAPFLRWLSKTHLLFSTPFRNLLWHLCACLFYLEPTPLKSHTVIPAILPSPLWSASDMLPLLFISPSSPVNICSTCRCLYGCWYEKHTFMGHCKY